MRQTKLNPLKNRSALRKLNPHALVVKKYAKINNERRRLAREVLRKKRAGTKVTAEELKKATETLGIKLRTSKQLKAAIAKKQADVKARRERIAAKAAKNVEYRKTKAVTKKGTKSPPKKAAKK